MGIFASGPLQRKNFQTQRPEVATFRNGTERDRIYLMYRKLCENTFKPKVLKDYSTVRQV